MLRLLSVAVFLVLWEVLGHTVFKGVLFFSYPSVIAMGFVELVRDGDLLKHLWASGSVFLYGMGLSLAAIPLGIYMGRLALVDYSLDQYMLALSAIPRFAFVPLLMIWFGLDLFSKALIIFLGAFFPILFNVREGVKSIDPVLLEAAEAFGCRRWKLYKSVILPSVSSFIVAGLRLGIGRAIVGIVLVEMYSSRSGVGYLLIRSAEVLRLDLFFAILVSLALFAVAISECLLWLEKYLFPWRSDAVGMA